jgi:hypothetical protein
MKISRKNKFIALWRDYKMVMHFSLWLSTINAALFEREKKKKKTIVNNLKESKIKK